MKQGDKVICIDASNLQIHPSNFDKLPIEGTVYHVREMVPGYDYQGQPDGVKLDEINGRVTRLLCYDGIERNIETHFRQNRFRVIDEIDIAHFEEKLVEKSTLKIINHE
jgi:hypothetical protein